MQTNYIVFIVRDSNYDILVIKNRFITAMFTLRGIVYAMAVPVVPSTCLSQASVVGVTSKPPKTGDCTLHDSPATLHRVPEKNVHLLFFEYLCQKLTDFNDFWQVKS